MRTAAKAQDLEMISQLWFCQGQHCWREEHGLVVRMRDQETYPLVI